MGKFEKKLLNPSVVLTFRELEYLLCGLGYIEKKTGKTSGSRKAYIQKETQHIVRIHKPHPGNEMPRYVKKYIVKELRKEGRI